MELVWRGAFLIMGNLEKIVVVIAAQIQTRLEEFLPDLWMMLSCSSAAGTISPFNCGGLGTYKKLYPVNGALLRFATFFLPGS